MRGNACQWEWGSFLTSVLMGCGVVVGVQYRCVWDMEGRKGHGKHEVRGAGADQSMKGLLGPATKACSAVRSALCRIRNEEPLSGF